MYRMGTLIRYIFFCLCLIVSYTIKAQDKIVLKSGETKMVYIVSITDKMIIYRAKEDSEDGGHFYKTEVLLVEKKDGTIIMLDTGHSIDSKKRISIGQSSHRYKAFQRHFRKSNLNL
jgi:hypothetical protein